MVKEVLNAFQSAALRTTDARSARFSVHDPFCENGLQCIWSPFALFPLLADFILS